MPSVSVGILFLQQLVDMVDIVERVVDKETQLGNDTQLVADPRAQLIPDGLCVGVHVLDDLLAFLRGEHAQVSRAYAQFG